jgi:hypothetical protein
MKTVSRLTALSILTFVLIPQLTRAQTGAGATSRLEMLLRKPGVLISTDCVLLPKIGMGFLGRNAGELFFRACTVKSATEEARGVQVRIDTSADDDTSFGYIDEHDLQPLIDAVRAMQQMRPFSGNATDQRRELSYESTGRFRVVAEQEGHGEMSYRFVTFAPVALLAAPRNISPTVKAAIHGDAEWRLDGGAEALIAVTLRGGPKEARKVLDLLVEAQQHFLPNKP